MVVLNEQQKRAVMETEGPMLVLAGAGSGKTRVLTLRVAELIKNGVHPLSILAITFTNKAAEEMKQRISEHIDFDISSMWVSTFHSMCVRILRISGKYIGYSSDFSIYDSDDSSRIIKSVLSDMGLKDDKSYSPRVVKSAISRFKNTSGLLEDCFDFCNRNYPLIAYNFSEIYEKYSDELKKQNALDFDDLLLKTLELLTEFPEVLEKYRNRFRYVLVDEYQDTNRIQYEIVRLLSSKHRNIFVVGDDDQSIYAFRGANVSNILNFERDFPGAKLIKLEQNYRSDRRILDVANCIIRNNTARKGKELWSSITTGARPCYYCAGNEYSEAEFIARTVRNIKNDGGRYSEVAVLYRQHTLSRIIEEKLKVYSVPYCVYGGVSFYERMEIKDILAFLTLAVNPKSDLAFRRIVNVPKRGIGETTVKKISSYAVDNNLSCLDIVLSADRYFSGAILQKLKSFAAVITEIVNAVDSMSVPEIMEYVLKKISYREMLISEYGHEAESRLQNIDELVNSAYEFDSENDGNLADFMQSISLYTDMDNVNENDDCVTLLTMHAAKGLEFDCVFICGFEENIFPTSKSVDENNIEEERRLCYVAVTRARKSLYFTFSSQRNYFGSFTCNAPSRFFDEIDEKLLTCLSPAKKKHKVDGNVSFDKKWFTGSIKNPSMNKKHVDAGKFVPGVCVRHRAFGNGVVVSVSGTADQSVAVVDFEAVGRKKLFIAFAPLEVI